MIIIKENYDSEASNLTNVPGLKYNAESIIFMVSRMIKTCPNHKENLSKFGRVQLLPMPHAKYYADHGNLPCEDCIVTKLGYEAICNYLRRENYYVGDNGFLYKKEVENA